MTLEELAEKLGIELTDENRAWFAALISAQTTGLKKNRDQLQADLKKAKEALKAFDGIDAAELAEALSELDIEAADIIERLKAKPPEGADAAAIKAAAEAEADKKYQRKITAAEKRAADAEAATAASNKARIDSEIERALIGEITAKKGISDLLMPMLRGRVKGEIGDDGKVVITVLAANGDEMQGAGGAAATVADLVETIRRDEKFGIAFEAEGGGSGSTGDTKRKNTRAGNPYLKGSSHYSLTEQSKLRAANPTLADQLKREADRAAPA